MKVKELIEILQQCDPEKTVGTFANNHYTSEYNRHHSLSVAERGEFIYIGNFSGYGLPTKSPYTDQFRDAITKFYKDSAK